MCVEDTFLQIQTQTCSILISSKNVYINSDNMQARKLAAEDIGRMRTTFQCDKLTLAIQLRRVKHTK